MDANHPDGVILRAYSALTNLLWTAYPEFYPGDEWLDPEHALQRLISDLRALRQTLKDAGDR